MENTEFERVLVAGLAPATSSTKAETSGVSHTTLDASTDTNGEIIAKKGLINGKQGQGREKIRGFGKLPPLLVPYIFLAKIDFSFIFLGPN